MINAIERLQAALAADPELRERIQIGLGVAFLGLVGSMVYYAGRDGGVDEGEVVGYEQGVTTARRIDEKNFNDGFLKGYRACLDHAVEVTRERELEEFANRDTES